METGTIVEYIDKKQIVCGVVVQAKKEKVRLLTEDDKEVSLSGGRVFHPDGRLDTSLPRASIVLALKRIATRRENLKNQVNILELWEVLHTENEWVDARTMAELAFSGDIGHDHVSAVVRAFFEDRVHFKFDIERFFPHSEEQVRQILAQAEEAARRQRMIEEGGDFLRASLKENNPAIPPGKEEVVAIVKEFHLFEKEAHNHDTAKKILERAGIDPQRGVFPLLVHLGAYGPDENTELLQLEIPTAFSPEVTDKANHLCTMPGVHTDTRERRDLTGLSIMTIDGQSTLDYDDAISLETYGDEYRVGIHISDVAHFIKTGELLDAEAMCRGSSIYMPDRKVPMLPPHLAEGLFSLKAHEVRPAVSVLARMDKDANVLDYDICTSLIRVRRQLTYHEVNLMADADKEIIALCSLAEKLREHRSAGGALLITLPEINVWLDENREVVLHRINRESPSRMMVSEIMILANWLMARFLSKTNTPGVFRAQAEPRSRLFEGEGSLFQNWMQRRHLARFELGAEAAPHSGLGLDAYVTATSPIRKYFDLVTQRQIRGALGCDNPLSREEIGRIIQTVQEPLVKVSRVQANRNRYWILKYLEKRTGCREEALVLERRKDRCQVLLTDYMLECHLPITGDPPYTPGAAIQVTIRKVDPRALFIALSQ
jgi:exoribonuclease-2